MTEPEPPELYLASSSPRRRELLARIGVRFARVLVDVDESVLGTEAPIDYVTRLALAKARAGWRAANANGRTPLPTLGADTAVVIDGQILGKPTDKSDGLGMLARLSGREHQVFTAVALVQNGREQATLSVSRVRFRELSSADREAYWDTGEPVDKAGGYGVQGLGACLVSELHGSYFGVMGLPLFETAELLRAFGIDVLRRPPPQAIEQ